ncbi:MAG: S-adenosylmethionine:tRNA ribosyltransferase-isomerase [Chitinophagaceae bacterium]|nr:S-adenosylmethionine:tRNA ribosyltransferase-isomerase [Chitinophagaceae bacterium]
MNPQSISIRDYTYPLPEDRIALRPLEERDASKLLVYNAGTIRESVYADLPQHLPENSLLIFNDTKVIRARVLFKKPSGGVIEIFCLEPYEPISDYQVVMNKKGSVKWKCMIGGASKWKEGFLEKEGRMGNEKWKMENGEWTMRARLTEKLEDAYVVEFSWDPADKSFAELIELAGDIPLPPYIKRTTDFKDTERYQTIYAREEGSVAAPTAGLHFTASLFEKLKEKHIASGFVTLHVGAGTFKPVKAATMNDHVMHAEWIDVSLDMIETLSQQRQDLIAVGTTSLRTLESLYWMGVKLIVDPTLQQVELSQWEVYQEPLQSTKFSVDEALNALANWMKVKKFDRLFTQTQILIAPGYRFKMVNALVTNFHQPGSTLLLLVAAAIGDDWKKVYQYALDHGYRFLSYGDGCLLRIKG